MSISQARKLRQRSDNTKTERLEIRLAKNEIDDIKKLAQQKGLTVSEYMRELVERDKPQA